MVHQSPPLDKSPLALPDPEWIARTAMEAGGAGVWMLEIASGRVAGDAAMARTFGLSPERCRAGEPVETFLAAVHAEDRERVRLDLTQAPASGELRVDEFRVRGENGPERWVEGRGGIERDRAGKVSRTRRGDARRGGRPGAVVRH